MNQEELGAKNYEDEHDQNCKLGGTNSHELEKDEHDQDCEPRKTIRNKKNQEVKEEKHDQGHELVRIG
jgi:hypothetical protein